MEYVIEGENQKEDVNNILKSEISHLMSVVPVTTFKNYKVMARVIRIVDGDTIEVVFPVDCSIWNGTGSFLYRTKARLSGIDAGKITTDLGQQATRLLNLLLLERGYLIYLHIHKQEMYGRVLVTMYNNDKLECNINDLLLSSGQPGTSFREKCNDPQHSLIPLYTKYSGSGLHHPMDR